MHVSHPHSWLGKAVCVPALACSSQIHNESAHWLLHTRLHTAEEICNFALHVMREIWLFLTRTKSLDIMMENLLQNLHCHSKNEHLKISSSNCDQLVVLLVPPSRQHNSEQISATHFPRARELWSDIWRTWFLPKFETVPLFWFVFSTVLLDLITVDRKRD